MPRRSGGGAVHGVFLITPVQLRQMVCARFAFAARFSLFPTRQSPIHVLQPANMSTTHPPTSSIYLIMTCS